MIRSLPIVALALLSALVLTACPVQGEDNGFSGSDGVKAGARELPFGRLDMDTVDRVSGDMTDWKYFRVPSTGVLKVTVAFDEAEAGGVAVIRDALGVQLARLEHRGQDVLDAQFRGEPGLYYVEVFAQAGRTDYVVEVAFEPLY